MNYHKLSWSSFSFVFLRKESECFPQQIIFRFSADPFGLRLILNPQLDEYINITWSNYIDDGFILQVGSEFEMLVNRYVIQVGGSGDEFMFVEPIGLAPGELLNESINQSINRFPNPSCSFITQNIHNATYV